MPTTILIGGYKDGQEITADFVENDIIHIPGPPPEVSIVFEQKQAYPFNTLEKLVYQVVLDENGFKSIDDQGRYRHKLVP